MTASINYEEVTNRIGYLLARLCHAHRNNVQNHLTELDLHVGQEMFLLKLSNMEGSTQSEIADSLSVQQATVTRMLNRMERSNLVERCKDEEDQRVSRVYLTEHGRSLIQPIADIWQAVEDELLIGFTMEEKVLLRRFLIQMRENMASTNCE